MAPVNENCRQKNIFHLDRRCPTDLARLRTSMRPDLFSIGKIQGHPACCSDFFVLNSAFRKLYRFFTVSLPKNAFLINPSLGLERLTNIGLPFGKVFSFCCCSRPYLPPSHEC